MTKQKTTLGNRVELLRKHSRLSQSAFGNKIGLSYVAVANIENGKTQKPHPDTLKSIVEVFGTTYEWLESEKGEMLPVGQISKKSDTTEFAELKIEIEFWKNKYNEVFAMLNNVLNKK